MPIDYYIFLSIALFCIGIVGVLTRRNAIIIFMCIELMLNAVNLLLVAFSKMHHLKNAAVNAISRKRRTIICVFYYGSSGSRSKCWAGDHCNDVQEYSFGGCKLFEQVKTLKE